LLLATTTMMQDSAGISVSSSLLSTPPKPFARTPNVKLDVFSDGYCTPT
jgi:hypothetical protein